MGRSTEGEVSYCLLDSWAVVDFFVSLLSGLCFDFKYQQFPSQFALIVNLCNI